MLQVETATNGARASHKPAILCLHGGGTNSSIFNMQTVRIRRALSSQFDFIFPDAPFETEPGPGVLPVFEGCGPYRRWTVIGDDHKPEQTEILLRKVLEEQRMKDGRGFVGVLGFSQGARVAAGLLLEQQMRSSDEKSEAEGLKFGVFLMGTCPPLTSKLSVGEKAEVIGFPSLHVLGKYDQWREYGRMLFSTHFNPEKSKLVEFEVGHRLPIEEQDNQEIVDEILRMYRETSRPMQLHLVS